MLCPKTLWIWHCEDIRKNLDKGNIGCGIFIDLQKVFDTVIDTFDYVEHDILLAKLEHYGIHGIKNEISW